MGLFDFLKKPKVCGTIVKGNPKINYSSVFVNANSKVYHCELGGCDKSDAKEMTEAQALARGLRRCKKCDWHDFDWRNRNG